ncbi:OmpA family protein [uncultured Lamprocystis sp.]|uniref:OmpA family protein n=1 Tax=uncultured Lamprocystis sp. TaxID=543132 RepID=UPI0025D44DD9|nr:OmpA family protein [uncultured Lamprocystis sp.]
MNAPMVSYTLWWLPDLTKGRPRSIAALVRRCTLILTLGATIPSLLYAQAGPAPDPQPTRSVTSGLAQPAERPGSAPGPIGTFEQGPGVLGISLRTQRQAQLKDYVSEPVGLVALGLEDLRFAPVNKRTHVEVNLTNRIPFEGKGDQVGPKAKRTLDALAGLFADNPRTRVKIIVHTDDQGDAGYNLRLSQRAAEAVKQYLVGRGVAAERLTPVGRGEEAPLAATGKRTPTRQERERNRRVELVIEPLEPSDQPGESAPKPPTETDAKRTAGEPLRPE